MSLSIDTVSRDIATKAGNRRQICESVIRHTAATFASMNIKNQAMHAYKSSLAVSEADKKGQFCTLVALECCFSIRLAALAGPNCKIRL